MAEVGAVILAAGGSSRFGQAKQLVDFRGQTLLARAIEAARQSGCEPVMAVIGSESSRMKSAIPDGVVIVENAQWRSGIASSIRTGIEELLKMAPRTDGVLLLACDQPLVTGEVVTGLIEHWSNNGQQIAASAYADTLGIPAMFSRSYFEDLLRLKGNSGAKSIILLHRDKVIQVPFRGGSHDIDTPADLSRIDEQL
jgi:molybdenum cofactor cytidylyltransferase